MSDFQTVTIQVGVYLSIPTTLFGNIWLTSSKLEGCSVSLPLTSMCLSYLVRRPGQAPKSSQIVFSPFTLDTWLVLLAVVLLYSTAIWTTDGTRSETWFVSYVVLGVGGLVGQGSCTRPKVLAGVWQLGALLVGSAYSSSLASRLLAPVTSSKPETIRQMVLANYTWALPQYPPMHLFLDLTVDIQRTLGHITVTALLCFYQANYRERQLDEWHRAWVERFRLVDSPLQLESLMAGSGFATWGQRRGSMFHLEYESFSETILDNMEAIAECANTHQIVFVYKKRSPWKDPIDNLLLRLTDTGLSRKVATHVLLDYSTKWPHMRRVTGLSKDLLRPPSSLSLTSVGGILLLLLIGNFVSLAVFIYEVLTDQPSYFHSPLSR